MDINSIRAQFPVLQQKVYDKPLVYLDSGATMQKPLSVIEAMDAYYMQDNANVHRGVHALSMRADKVFEETREKIRKFINAAAVEEIIYTSGTTEAINLVAQSFGQAFLRAGDEIVISEMEHHSNIVPWQLVCERYQTKLRVIPVTENGELDMQAYAEMLNAKTKLVSITHVSNVLGTVNPLEQIIERAHAQNIPVLVDAAQSVHHVKIDVQVLGCDFLVFSGHKMYGPTGIGVLYGKQSYLEMMPPYQGGGAMIAEVSFEKTTYNKLPYKFEAGTPNIAGVVGLGAAIDFINYIGLDFIEQHERELMQFLVEKLEGIEGVRILGNAENRCSVLSFLMDDIHAHDIATMLDRQGIAVRAGHHCAMPLMKKFKVPATTRVTLAVYNTKEDIEKLAKGILALKEVFA